MRTEILAFILVVAMITTSNPGGSVSIQDLVLPSGEYLARISWGDLVLEEKVVASERPVTVIVNVPQINIRKPLTITIAREHDVFLDMVLTPSPFGYELHRLYVDPRVKITDSKAVIYETVTITNVTVSWIADQQVKLIDIRVNGIRPLDVIVEDSKVTIPNLVIDDKLDIEVLFEDGRIEASFLIAAEGLQAFSRFEGPFSKAYVTYEYGLKGLSWVIIFPVTREANSSVIFRDRGYVEAGRSANETKHPVTSVEIANQSYRETPTKVEGPFAMIKEYAGRLRTEITILAGLVTLAGLLKRRVALIVAGVCLLILMLVVI